MGHHKLEMQVRQRFYWPTLSADVHKFCQECDICPAIKGSDLGAWWVVITTSAC